MTERLDAFLEELSRRNLDDLGVVALSEPDPTARGALLRRATAAAAAAGADRLAEVRAVPDRVQAIAFRSFAFRGYEPTWFGLNWGRSIGRADDRARLVAAVEDAAVADVVADLLPADDLAAVRARVVDGRCRAARQPSDPQSTRGGPHQRRLARDVADRRRCRVCRRDRGRGLRAAYSFATLT